MWKQVWNWMSGRSARLAKRRQAQAEAFARFENALRARYDAAQTTRENEKHWAAADMLSPTMANSPDVRTTLVKRARYERDNNCYASGIVDTIVYDLVGSGTRLQLQEPDDQVNRVVEERWKNWTAAVQYPEKLQTYVGAYLVSGEGISVFFDNPRVDDPVSLDFRLVETEQMTTPGLMPWQSNEVDGIQFDQYGNPDYYTILRDHPGDASFQWGVADRFPARYVTHWYRKLRPGQSRGIPQLTQALPLFAQLRRYTLAVLSAAEIAASFAAILESDASPDEGAAAATAFEELEIARGMMTVAPNGWKMNQFDPKQPAQSYEMFKRELLNEIARVLCVPYNIAAGNSMNYNYSSGRLDHLIYFNMLRVRRDSLQAVQVDPTFRMWYRWGRGVPGYFPASAPANPKRNWFWDSRRSIDPEKDAKADTERLNNGTTTLAEIYADDGRDWEEALAQRAREIRRTRELGLDQVGGLANAA